MFQIATSCSPGYLQNLHAQIPSLTKEFLLDFHLEYLLSCFPQMLAYLCHISAQGHQTLMTSTEYSHHILTQAFNNWPQYKGTRLWLFREKL